MHIQFQLCHLKFHFISNFKFQVKKFKCHIFFSVVWSFTHVAFLCLTGVPTSFVAQTSCHYQMLGSTGSWESLVGQRSCQANRWGGHQRGMSHWVFPESKNRMWLMQFSQGVVQCQKRLADVLGPINREPSSHSLQLPGWITAVWITGKMEDGISLCALWMWYQLQGTHRDSWTRNWIRTSFLW